MRTWLSGHKHNRLVVSGVRYPIWILPVACFLCADLCFHRCLGTILQQRCVLAKTKNWHEKYTLLTTHYRPALPKPLNGDRFSMYIHNHMNTHTHTHRHNWLHITGMRFRGWWMATGSQCICTHINTHTHTHNWLHITGMRFRGWWMATGSQCIYNHMNTHTHTDRHNWLHITGLRFRGCWVTTGFQCICTHINTHTHIIDYTLQACASEAAEWRQVLNVCTTTWTHIRTHTDIIDYTLQASASEAAKLRQETAKNRPVAEERRYTQVRTPIHTFFMWLFVYLCKWIFFVCVRMWVLHFFCWIFWGFVCYYVLVHVWRFWFVYALFFVRLYAYMQTRICMYACIVHDLINVCMHVLMHACKHMCVHGNKNP